MSTVFRSILRFYSQKKNLSKSALLDSYHAMGTEYEMTVKRALEAELKTPLTRVGGSGDKGIDHIGKIKLEGDAEECALAVQCKLKHDSKKTIDSKTIRELIGTLSQLKGNPIGILSSNAPLSAPARSVLMSHKGNRLIYTQIDHRPGIDHPITNITCNYLFRMMHPTMQPIKVRRFNGLMDYTTFNLK